MDTAYRGILRCGDCGCQSEFTQAFRRRRAGLLRRPLLCPACWSNDFFVRFKITLGIIGVAFLGGLVLHSFDASISLGTGLINLGIIYLFMWIMVIPHELGHAVIARLFGFRVFQVIIGHGNALLTRTLLGCEWEFRPLPVGGVTVAASPSPRVFRLRKFFMFLGGPLVNVLFVLIPFWLMPRSGGANPSSFWEASLLIDLAIANTVLLVVNLWPRKVATVAGVTENDGLALLTIPFSSGPKIEADLAAYYALVSRGLYRRKQYAQAVRPCEEGLALYPDSKILRTQLGMVLLSMNEIKKARESFIEALKGADVGPEDRMILFNNVAIADLLSGGGDLLGEADRYSAQAYRNIPWVPGVTVTRGEVLVELGRVDEGLALLRETITKQTDPELKADIAAYMAIGENRRGNFERALRYLDTTRTLDPQCRLLNRVMAELNQK